MLCDTLLLNLSTDHEASNVLLEDKWDLSLGAKLHEMGALLRTLGKEHAIICNDTDGVTVKVSEASNQGCAVTLLKLVEAGTIKDTT